MRAHRWALVATAVLLVAASACGRSGDDDGASASPTTAAASARTDRGALGAADLEEACASEPLEASEVGVTADTITIEVMADTGSPLAPGIFQGNVDAIVGFAEYVNDHGGVGCRDLVVREWDSKFNPTEVKNGQLDACANALAFVGNNSVFNPDPSAMEACNDKAGATTGLPNVAAFAVDTNEMCSPMTVGVNTRAEACPVRPNEEREFERIVGPMKWLLEQHPGLHGTYVANGDLPSTRVSAMPDIAVQEAAGIVFDAKILQSARDAQSDYVPRIRPLQTGSNYVYNGSSDTALALYMKEAVAQGVDTTKVVWACNVACYTKTLLSTGGGAVEGAYMWLPFIPLEETEHNEAMAAYVDTIGAGKVDTWGITSWQAAMAFQHVVDQIVLEDGPNAITRAALLEGLAGLEDFTAGGISGPRAMGESSPCYVMVQVQDGAFARVWPEELGTLDCDEGNLATVRVNPEAAAARDFG